MVQDASAVWSGAEGSALSKSPYMLAGKLVAASAPFIRSTALSYACTKGILLNHRDLATQQGRPWSHDEGGSKH